MALKNAVVLGVQKKTMYREYLKICNVQFVHFTKDKKEVLWKKKEGLS